MDSWQLARRLLLNLSSPVEFKPQINKLKVSFGQANVCTQSIGYHSHLVPKEFIIILTIKSSGRVSDRGPTR